MTRDHAIIFYFAGLCKTNIELVKFRLDVHCFSKTSKTKHTNTNRTPFDLLWKRYGFVKKNSPQQIQFDRNK